MTIQERITQAFERRFKSQPTFIVRAPGRVNLIGEHTDYNEGFVLPMAINRAIYLALRPREDRYVFVESMDFGDYVEFSLEEMVRGRHSQWAEYVKGTAWALEESGYALNGWEGVVAGDVPIGAGLSSSAAIEMATARAFSALGNVIWDAAELARLGQKTENQWIGVQSGIMDQMISAGAVAGNALLIDCRWLNVKPAPLPSGISLVILDTATRRELTHSGYNQRRSQCEAAAQHFGVRALRDVTMSQFIAGSAGLDEQVMKRARHVISENARTLQAAAAMRAGDAGEVGRLMNDSHISMRDDFEITRPEIDTMVRIAQTKPGCFGARMTGGGFGGCCVALVDAEQASAFSEAVAAEYTQATGLTPEFYISNAAGGAEIVSNSSVQARS
ncbi:MAG: galactokinase [Anaerolineae bacterium]|nr:galactokinase [Anaerolineae bacterium]